MQRADAAPPVAEERLGRHRPVALRPLLVARRGAELERPIGPDQALVLPLRRARQDFELRHRRSALAVGGADAVRAGIAAADYDDVPAFRADRLAGGHGVARHPPVLLALEIHG